jgi:hypothetical protein
MKQISHQLVILFFLNKPARPNERTDKNDGDELINGLASYSGEPLLAVVDDDGQECRTFGQGLPAAPPARL